MDPEILFSIQAQSSDWTLITDGCTDIRERLSNLKAQNVLGSIVAHVKTLAICGDAHRPCEMTIANGAGLAFRIKHGFAIGIEDKNLGNGCVDYKDPRCRVLLPNCDVGRLIQQAGCLDVFPESVHTVSDGIELLYALISVIDDVRVAR